MKRLLGVVIVSLTFAAVAGAGKAGAAFWPANCDAHMRAGHPVLALQCVDRHLNNLNRRVRAQRTDINFVLNCTNIVRGVSRFSDYASHPDTTVATTALDFDTSDPQVWMSTVRPRCVDTSAGARGNQFQLYRIQ